LPRRIAHGNLFLGLSAVAVLVLMLGGTAFRTTAMSPTASEIVTLPLDLGRCGPPGWRGVPDKGRPIPIVQLGIRQARRRRLGVYPALASFSSEPLAPAPAVTSSRGLKLRTESTASVDATADSTR